MFARVHRLRTSGAPNKFKPPPSTEWTNGIFEFSEAVFIVPSYRRRLVLRTNTSSPDRGIIFELFKPELINVLQDDALHYRGIEPVKIDGETIAAVVQEWLVKMM
jgi:hypothetical protein